MFMKDPSFRIGCGRYIQSRGALKSCAEEVLRLGRAPRIIAGKTAWAVAGAAIEKSLSEANIPCDPQIYKGTCNADAAKEFAEKARADGSDMIVGVGGGVIMDFSKLVAALAGLPIINIPTSTATCAAFTPLSVCYTEDGRTLGTVHHKTEVNAVIADPEILICQPPRLLLAGVFDAMAKFLEIKHRYCPADTSYSLGLDYAYVMAARSYEELSRKTADCLEAIQKGEVNEAFEQTVYTLIAATGAISGIARGSNQTALGHKFYEITRALYPAESKPYLHGELVGVGLLLQNEYNGERERNAELLAFMKKYGLPHSPESAGVPKEALPAFYDSIMKSSAMHDTAPEEAEKLHQSLEYLWRYA